jgi:hypothetical protein
MRFGLDPRKRECGEAKNIYVQIGSAPRCAVPFSAYVNSYSQFGDRSPKSAKSFEGCAGQLAGLQLLQRIAFHVAGSVAKAKH